MQILTLTAIALVAAFVKAQDACIINCTVQACPDFPSDIACFCSTGTADIIACLEANCTSADLTTAQALGQQYCCTILLWRKETDR
jgi:hypothetical protein